VYGASESPQDLPFAFEHVEEKPSHITTEEVREWDYGDYEGLRNQRQESDLVDLGGRVRYPA
jgi:broad specificity phosphatase PhoE